MVGNGNYNIDVGLEAICTFPDSNINVKTHALREFGGGVDNGMGITALYTFLGL